MAISPNVSGGFAALAAVFFFSVNDAVIKALSDGYALHQVMFIRSIIGLFVVVCIFAPFSGGLCVFRTQRLTMHLLRGMFVVMANMSFFLSIATLALADAVAIFFVSPLVITVFSVIFLRETVGPWRWAAVVIGLIGVLVIVRPGSDAFQIASLLPIFAAVCYAALHILTRKIGATEGAVTMAFYIQITFVLVSLISGLVLGDGKFAGSDNPTLSFLLRAWGPILSDDIWRFAVIGIGIALAGVLISYAYRMGEAAFVAPFEYVAMPLAILYGVIFFGEVPDAQTYLGSTLIVGSGLIMLWREHSKSRNPLARPARR